METGPDDYMIVHYDNEKWHLGNLIIDRNNKIITGKIMMLSQKHYDNEFPKGAAKRYRPKIEKPENEVHLYITEYLEKADGSIEIEIGAIQRLDIYDRNIGATIASYIAGGLLTTTIILVIVIIIALLTKSSCPFIYIYEDGEYKFVGETFGGAIAQNMERDDYMELPGFKPDDGKYKIKIANELKERQYTDVAQLMVVEHPESTRVLLDKNGKVHVLKNPLTPTLAVGEQGEDHVKRLQEVDENYYAFLDENVKKDEFSSITMTFSKPAFSTSANLILNLKNSMWLEHTFDLFHAQFGDQFERFAEIRAKASKEKNMKWAKDQGLPLAVKVKKAGKWELVDYVDMVGPLASRNVVVPIPELIDGEDKLEVKLECGFHFWEMDYAAIDYGDNNDYTKYILDCSTAVDETGVDVRDDLLKVDQDYLFQPNIGNEAFLVYDAPVLEKEGNEQSVFLYSRGYYEPIREYSGKANLWKLRKMWRKGTFAKFSKEQFDELSVVQ